MSEYLLLNNNIVDIDFYIFRLINHKDFCNLRLVNKQINNFFINSNNIIYEIKRLYNGFPIRNEIDDYLEAIKILYYLKENTLYYYACKNKQVEIVTWLLNNRKYKLAALEANLLAEHGKLKDLKSLKLNPDINGALQAFQNEHFQVVDWMLQIDESLGYRIKQCALNIDNAKLLDIFLDEIIFWKNTF